MSKKAGVLLALVGVAVAWHVFGSSESSEREVKDAPDVLVNRIWINELPTNPKQMVDVFLMIDHPKFGQFLRTSAYEGEYALFEWRDKKAKSVDIVMPQTDKKHRLKFAIASEGCEPFDYCMKVKGAPRGAKKYYSMQDWIIEPGSGSLDLEDVQSAIFPGR
jgi:hypothetical protein